MLPDRPDERRVLAFVVNDAWFFVSHRLPIAERAIAEGYEVHVIARADDSVERLRAIGCRFHAWRIEPRGNDPRGELRGYRELGALLRAVSPDVLHLVTIKAVLYGGLWARRLRVPAVVYAIAGLGSVFVGAGLRARWLRASLMPLYRRAIGHPRATLVFQNGADRDAFVALFPRLPARIRLIRGSGVDLDAFPPIPEPADGPIVVTLAARLLRDKGIEEFVDAARRVRDASGAGSVRFQVAGGYAGAGNPAALSERDVARLGAAGPVEFLGHRDDVAALYAASHIVCLPSWREGLPKALVEAAAAGRAVVTTDVPGCRDATEPDVSALTVPVRDAEALAGALLALVRDGARRRAMGAAGRALAEREFRIEKIVAHHLAMYAELLGRSVPDSATIEEATDAEREP